MGSDGYRLAADLTYQPGEVIMEVGAESAAGGSTSFLARLGPPVVSIDINGAAVAHAAATPNVAAMLGRAESILVGWGKQVRFAWLDGYDWPYDDLPPDILSRQTAEYEAAGLELSKEASQRSHLIIATLLAPWVPAGGVVAFDDTWQTPEGGWDGKGGRAVPWLLAFADRAGPRFELWRGQDDTQPWHDGYVAVWRLR